MNRKSPGTAFIRKKTALILLLMLIVIPVIGLFYLDQHLIVHPLKIGEQVPAVKIQTLEKKEVSLSSVLVRKSVLVFYSASCSHCQQEMDDLRLLYQILKDSLNIAAISLDGMFETKDFVVSHNIPFSVYLDNNDEAKRSFRVGIIPAMFFIDTDQRIMHFKAGERKREQSWSMLKKYAGYIDDSLEQL